MELSVPIISMLSFVLTGGVISNAFVQKKQFYPSVVYITKSSTSMAVMYIQMLVLVIIVGKVFRRIFFGQLRALETEHLMERAWHAVIETCLAFTVFRDDFSPRFVAMFTLLLFLKCFHWLAEDRVDYMERSPVITMLFHVRLMGVLALLSSADSFFVSHAYFMTLLRGPSVQLVFGFEYAILMTTVFMIAIKYTLHTIDLRSVHPWESKAVYLLYAELVLSFTRVVLYFMFAIVMMKLHTFPLFTVRPMYLTVRAFKKALNDVVMSRRAIRNMNTLYPDATQEELEAGDNVCIICREEMTSAAKKLPCNHIFHTSCLRSWFQRQQTCPTCRMNILSIPEPAVRDLNAAAAEARNLPNGVPPTHAPTSPGAAAAQTLPGAMPTAGSGQPGEQPSTSASTTTTGQVPFQNMGLPQFGQTIPPMPGLPGMPGMPGMAGGFQMPALGGMPMGGFSPIMPHMPFMLPFPPSPITAGMTDEEVRSMEGQERRAVEARIQCLRNIQTLLDAASVQLQQYLSILSALSAAPIFQAPVSAGNSSQTATSATSTTNLTSTPINNNNEPSTSGSAEKAELKTTNEANVEGINPFLELSSDGNGDVTSSSLDSAGDPNDELSQIRLKRLQKFSSKDLSSENKEEE